MSILKHAFTESGGQTSVSLLGLPAAMRKEIRMLRRLGYDDQIIDRNLAAAIENNTTIEKELLASGAASSADHFKRLANYLVLPFQDRIDAACVTDRPHIDTLLADPRGMRLNNSKTERQYAVVPSASDVADLHLRLSSHPEIRRCVIITTPEAVRAAVWKVGETRRLGEKVNDLMAWEPRFSARIVFWGKQGFLLGSGVVTLLACLMIFTLQALLVTHIIFSALYFFTLLVRLASLRKSAGPKLQQPSDQQEALPVYTVLIPLYREARMIDQLTASMCRLDWPASKLDIKLICEADDHDTIKAITQAALPSQFELVIVPAGGPRTKPNALNYALSGARGRYVVIYDAEDRPHPNQLREAWQTFKSEPRELACLQAPLKVANIGDNWISTLYACEYTGLFRGDSAFSRKAPFSRPAWRNVQSFSNRRAAPMPWLGSLQRG